LIVVGIQRNNAK